MKTSYIVAITICLTFGISTIFWLKMFKNVKQPSKPNLYFWYEIGIIKANEQISKSKYLTEYEKRKIWLQIDSARKSDSLNLK